MRIPHNLASRPAITPSSCALPKCNGETNKYDLQWKIKRAEETSASYALQKLIVLDLLSIYRCPLLAKVRPLAPSVKLTKQNSIIAVHGLNGDSMNTWTHFPGRGKPSTMWLRDLLPEKLPSSRVMTFQYDASVVGNTSAHGVRGNASKLLQLLRDKREDDVCVFSIPSVPGAAITHGRFCMC